MIWEGKVKHVMNRLNVIEMTNDVFSNATAAERVKYIFYSINTIQKPGLDTLADEMEHLYCRLTGG